MLSNLAPLTVSGVLMAKAPLKECSYRPKNFGESLELHAEDEQHVSHARA